MQTAEELWFGYNFTYIYDVEIVQNNLCNNPFFIQRKTQWTSGAMVKKWRQRYVACKKHNFKLIILVENY